MQADTIDMQACHASDDASGTSDLIVMPIFKKKLSEICTSCRCFFKYLACFT